MKDAIELPPGMSFEPFPALGPPLHIYIGWDPREVDAYDVAKRTLIRRSSRPLSITPLVLHDLELAGLMRRPWSTEKASRASVRVAGDGPKMWDHISNAPMSTQFANSRWLAPLLAQKGWCLFVDCDVVFLADPAELFALADPDKAVMCVQHPDQEGPDTKMDGQPQTSYRRKNWSSVMLFNCDHLSNKGLTLDLINTKPGRDLHRFCWLDDSEIGSLPPEWNWLVGVQPRPRDPKLAHFTLGGPWLPEWVRQPHDDIWLGAAQDC